MCDAMRVAVTGAASPFSYALVYMLARGEVFGKSQPIILHLLDSPDKKDIMDGVAIELNDCAMPQLRQVIPTADPTVAFIAVTCAFLVSPMSLDGKDPKTLIAENLSTFKVWGKALNQYACKDVKVLVAGLHSHTNALIAAHYGSSIPRDNFSSFMRLHQNRAVGILAERLRVPTSAIHNVITWGNNSPTVFPDAGTATVTHCNTTCCMYDAINDEVYLQGPFVAEVQNREDLVMEKRKQSSAMSAAKAACDQMRDWWFGTPPDEYVSMGVISDGSYCVPKDIFFGFPVEVQDGVWSIVQGLPLDEFARSKLSTTANEIVEQKKEAAAACKAESARESTDKKEVTTKESKNFLAKK